MKKTEVCYRELTAEGKTACLAAAFLEEVILYLLLGIRGGMEFLPVSAFILILLAVLNGTFLIEYAELKMKIRMHQLSSLHFRRDVSHAAADDCRKAS